MRIRYSSSSNSRLVSSIGALAAVDLAGVGVEAQVADDQGARCPAGGRRRISARIRASSSWRSKGFDEVVVGAGVEALDAVVESRCGR